MSNGFQFLDIILFAMIAAFLILRLRSVLGRHKDPGEPPQKNDRKSFSADASKNNINKNVVSLQGVESDKKDQEETSTAETALEIGVKKIQTATNDFDPIDFLNGANTAFEMIVQAFTKGDTELLETLLNNEVYDNFLQAIRSRESNNQILENTLVRIVSSEIIEANMMDNFANVTVKIVSEQVNVMRNEGDEVVSGDPDHILVVTDIWTFARGIGAQDPNWMLIATRSLD